ncbi:MAG TPA: DinB family protein [Ohtaekwangia sp.]|nr:DinB family protein [Ohtaekwangia sp.]
MELKSLQEIFERDLTKLSQEIEAYTNEDKLWYTEKNIANSAGNLCLHLVGNLNTYIGKTLGKTNYIRNRDLEFSQKDVAKSTLLKMISETRDVVRTSLSDINPVQLNEPFPVKVFSETTTTGFMLIHLATHLSYHLGQINYHRRLLDTP